MANKQHAGESATGRGLPRRSLVLDLVRESTKNLAMYVPAVRAWRLQRPRAGAVFTGRDDELERYAFQSTRSLLDSIGSVRGLDVVEIGPGDFMTSGFSLLAAGAKSYTVVDRFVGYYEKAEAKNWYRAIEQAWARTFPELEWPAWLRADDFPEKYSDRVDVLAGPVEDAATDRTFDVVCSYQVGEHVTSIESFANFQARLLKSGGVAVHRVDFGPHDCWRLYPNPFTFLQFPDWLWALMGSQRGTPNRQRCHEFVTAFEAAGLSVEVSRVKHFAAHSAAPKKLAKRFRSMPADSLGIESAVFTCRHIRSRAER
jgi:SAM-dependent methyltransferase